MPKFFVDSSCVSENQIILIEDNVKHIKNVLRLGINDEILINDRQGIDYKCIIKSIDNDTITVNIVEKYRATTEPSTQVVLFQSLIKGEKMDLVIQKSVEIGVHTIIPIQTARCVVKIETSQKAEAKLKRWNKIAEAASKQSGRGIVPKVMAPMTMQDAFQFAQNLDLCIIPYEKESTNSIRSVLQTTNSKTIGVWIGPEGGFEESEISDAQQQGVQAVTLGKRILRSETAGLVVISNIMYEMGEME